jgi:ubiquinone/menaquinone biosynthesis C-methylase UbiE
VGGRPLTPPRIGRVGGGWEHVAGEWTEFARSGEDVPFHWHGDAFLRLMPPPRGLTLDAGCGEGRLSRRLGELGHRVVALDASPTLVRLAQEADPGGDYRVADVTALPFGEATFDLVVSFMVLQDVEEYGRAIGEAARVLREGGCFCVAIVHPVASSGDWSSDDIDAAHIVENYCTAWARPRPPGGRLVIQHHRPIADYLHTLSDRGFALDELQELATRRRSPGRIPFFLDFRAVKR